MTPSAASPTFSDPPLGGYIHSRKFLSPDDLDTMHQTSTIITLQLAALLPLSYSPQPLDWAALLLRPQLKVLEDLSYAVIDKQHNFFAGIH